MKAVRRLDEETMEPVEIIEWLAGEECHALDEAGLAAGAGRRRRAAELPLDWLSLHLRALHPEIVGRMHAWAASGLIADREREFGFDQFASLAGSPVRRVMDRREWLAVHPAAPGNDAWRPFLDVFCRAGIAELLIAPLSMGNGPVSAAAFGTQRPDGFAEGERAVLERLLPSLRCACELRVLRRVEASLLDTYVGAASGRHILAGQIRRGEVETLEAALLLCDLRGFTALSNRLPTRRVLELLNRYFDQIVPAITDGGGEVLKFMGDAVLAFFHDEGGPRRSCLAAFAAARAALARLAAISEPDVELRAGIALHHGVVAYGNIGSGRRLDFTLIGRDVNLTSRIEGVCAATGRPLLMSARFVRLAGLRGAVSAGRHPVKGFEEPVELFAASPPTDER
jgi:adenylate cyclase